MQCTVQFARAMFSRTCTHSRWISGERKLPISVSTLNRAENRTCRMQSTSVSGSTDPTGSTNNIYVQVLPVILKPTHTDLSSKETDIAFTDGKILLCKWASGNFKDRYTGLIKQLSEREEVNIQNLTASEKYKVLLQIAESLLPSQLRRHVTELELVGLLNFDDPPACDEYIYKANLAISGSESIDTNHVIPFGEHSCFWYNWKEIPFQEMPADDPLWYPKVLWEEQKVKGTFTFGGWSEKTIKSYELHLVNQIE
ncbi:unnamed protein product [Orchesella dallaii]|uniref:Uncharacterized protein n=1 Tax=Orchesella dallaii TaxID=48710 RepID=A0ABP1QN15_9HEXA